jgi:hypothetical protein
MHAPDFSRSDSQTPGHYDRTTIAAESLHPQQVCLYTCFPITVGWPPASCDDLRVTYILDFAVDDAGYITPLVFAYINYTCLGGQSMWPKKEVGPQIRIIGLWSRRPRQLLRQSSSNGSQYQPDYGM